MSQQQQPPAPGQSGRDTDGCEVSVGRGGVLHKHLNGVEGASHSKERRASDPSPKRKELWPRTSERFALLLQLPVLAAPP